MLPVKWECPSASSSRLTRRCSAQAFGRLSRESYSLKSPIRCPDIEFKGVMSHQTLARDTRTARPASSRVRSFIQKTLDVKDAIEAEGIPVEVVSAGESWTYDICPTIPGVTEVEGGTYAH